MWFDSHCHLHICEEEVPLDDVVARARAAGVDDILTAGIDVESSKRSVEIARADGIHAAVGVHPNSSLEWGPDAARAIEELAEDANVVAIGETGIDLYHDEAPLETQISAFEDHIALAKRLDKALIIHTRASIEVALDVLETAGAPERLVFHCWSGDGTVLQKALGLGAFISFAGNVSFANAQDLRDSACKVPLDRLLVETDSPYLTPEPHRGKRNEPRNVAFVGDALARALDTDPHSLAERTSQNANRLFALGG
ncbi:MAG TPA: TatD family hydrolase [Actinomycetota bacterium]|nr:TatD family hydrolase [Actinomycetota bacterium]